MTKKSDPRTNLRVGLYTRISTDEDHQPYSLEAQADRLASYVSSQDDWRTFRHYTDQMTGTVLERPGLQRALADAKKGRFDLLLVFRVDRLARSVRSLALILEELDHAGVAFRSATEPFDTSSPAGRMMVQMLGVFAEFERATLIERVVAGMEKKAAKGGWNGGTRPFGYDYDRTTGYLVVNDTESPIARKIFELYVSGLWGSASIARWLNEKGYRTKRGALWSPNTVRNVIANPAYIGEVFFRGIKYPGQHPALIEPEVFQKAQKLLAERGDDASRRRSNVSEFLLSGTLFCARCGRRFVGVTANGHGGNYRYYTCASRAKLGTKICDQERLPAGDLERDVLAHLVAKLKDSALLAGALARLNERTQDERPTHDRELAALDRKIRDAKTATDRYLRAFETGALTAELCGERVLDLKQQLGALENRRQELQDALDEPPARATLKDVRAAASGLVRALTRGDTAKRKALLRKLLQIRVESRDRILPTIRLPLVRTMGDWVGPPGLEPGTIRL